MASFSFLLFPRLTPPSTAPPSYVSFPLLSASRSASLFFFTPLSFIPFHLQPATPRRSPPRPTRAPLHLYSAPFASLFFLVFSLFCSPSFTLLPYFPSRFSRLPASSPLYFSHFHICFASPNYTLPPSSPCLPPSFPWRLSF